MTATPRIKLPTDVKAGDIIEVKTLITHVMETGNRKDKDGNRIARDIINTFVATFEGKEVFRAEMGPGISANPYMSFQMRVTGAGIFEFAWTDDHGVTTTATETLKVA